MHWKIFRLQPKWVIKCRHLLLKIFTIQFRWEKAAVVCGIFAWDFKKPFFNKEAAG